MSKKRRRDTATVDTRMVEIYEDLANEIEEIRLKAARSLLSTVSSKTPLSKERVLEILTRLIRGLCSPRKAARLGFSVALTEFLVQILGNSRKEVPSQLDVPEVIDLLKKLTVAVGKVSGNETKNYELGRLFGAESVIRSGILFQPGAEIEHWTQILDIILELGKKKPWVRKECGWALYKSIDTLSEHQDHVQLLLDKISAYGLTKTPDGVAIWLGIKSTGMKVRFQESVWHSNDPLHRKEKTTLAKVLREAPSTTPDQGDGVDTTNQTGNWSPDLHFAWEVVVATLLSQEPTGDLKKKKKKLESLSFEDFWNEAVEGGLFSASSSDQRKAWGLTLFQRMLRSVPAELLPGIFTSKLVRCLINHLASSERYLHQLAERTMKSICQRIDTEPSVGGIVLKRLFFQEPAPSAHQISKSKIIEKLLSHVQEQAVSDILPIFSQMIVQPNEKDEKSAEASRRIAADQLVSYLKSQWTSARKTAAKLSGPNALMDKVLSFFVDFTYFDHQQLPLKAEAIIDPPISEQSREMFRTRIISCLNLSLEKHTEPAQFSYHLIAHIRAMDKKENGLDFLFRSEDAVRRTIDKAWATAEKIHSKSVFANGPRKQLLSSLEILYCLTMLQAYNGETDAVIILDELKTSYDSLLKHGQKTEQGSSDALIEILLSFASKPSSLFRRLAGFVFSAYTSEVGSEGLQAMIKILEAKESLAGQDKIFDQENDEDAEILDDEDLSDASDVSMTDPQPNGVSKVDINDSSAGSSNDDDDTESEDGPDEELAVFDAKLALALGTRSAIDDMAADESEESSDEDMNDQQMEAMDGHLETIFRERKNTRSKKSQNKDAKEAIVNFKCRVLDLLGIYVKQQYSNPLALDLLVPLLDAIRTTRNPAVSRKACDVIRDYSKRCKPKSVPPVPDVHPVFGMLRDIHQRASKEGSKAYGAACSQASLLLVKSLFAQDRETLDLVETVYGGTHKAFTLDPKSKVRLAFFTDWMNWSASARESYAYR